jgi:hypothetical protein
MILWGWLFVGLVGAAALWRATTTADDDVAILSGLIATGSWGMFSFQSLNVEIANGTELVTNSYPEMGFFGAALGVVGLFIALTGPIEEFGDAPEKMRNEME